MKVFFDTEFTGLRQDTSLISIGLVSEKGHEFYAEFTDYKKEKIDSWLENNVIANLEYSEPKEGEDEYYMVTRYDNSKVQDIYLSCSIYLRGDSKIISEQMKLWFSQFDEVEMWSDCLSYDWVLFNSLLADYSEGYPKLPSNINYIPFDICTLFKIKGIDPDISREEFSGMNGKKHNALYDAKVIRKCYELLNK